jgi:dienelactone hydrolase
MRWFAFIATVSAGWVLGAWSGDDNPPAGSSASSGSGNSSGAGGSATSGGGTSGAGGSISGGGAGGSISGGSGAAGANVGGSGNAAGSSGQGGAPTSIPVPREPCPTIAEGATLPFLHLDVRIVVAGSSGGPGPVLFYWHGTGGFDRASSAFDSEILAAIRAQGGLVVEPVSASPNGGAISSDTTGNGVWFYRDFEVADEVLGCAVEQLSIDTRRIYASGMSAGGLQTVAMSYARSNYVAAVVPYSGGIISGLTRTEATDPGNPFAAMIVYGGPDDRVLISFETASQAYHEDLTARGQFAFLCNHDGGHTIPAELGPSAWRFLQDHPWGTRPSPYAGGLPASFPDYCAL